MAIPKLITGKSISGAVREIVESDLSVQDALQRGYANLSAVAKMIKPAVENQVGRQVKTETLITSVKRLRGEYGLPSKAILDVIAKSVVNVRTDVAKLSVERSRRTLEAVRRMLANYQEEFLQVSESISAITMIFDQRLFEKTRLFFSKSDILESETNLAAIIVRSPRDIIKTPGCAIAFYNQVSRRHVNIEDTTSCFTDTIIVVRMEDVGRAFSGLTELVTGARKPSIGARS